MTERLSFIIEARDFSGRTFDLPLRFVVDGYSKAAQWGPQFASVRAWGNETELWRLAEKLRCPVRIVNERGDVRWWGYIFSVELPGASVSLDQMYNRVAVPFASTTPLSTTGQRDTSGWAQDSNSVTEYGYREKLESLSVGTTTAAARVRDTFLERHKYPHISRVMGYGADYAMIECHGWGDTLGWQYHNAANHSIIYAPSGSTTNNWGQDAQHSEIAQSFTVPAGDPSWAVKEVRMYLSGFGTPRDNITLHICSNVVGAPDYPGAELATTTHDPGDVSIPMWDLWSFTEAQEYDLTPGTKYWLKFHRTGGVDAANYYHFYWKAGYAGGATVRYDAGGGTWIATGEDLLFEIYGVQIITSLLSNMITASAEFITGVTISTNSDLRTMAYRDGDFPMLECAEELLEIGTTSDLRLVATIDARRRVTIAEEPTRGANDYRLMPDGRLFDKMGLAVAAAECVCGVWARQIGFVPPGIDVSALADPTVVFVESAEYDAVRGVTMYHLRDDLRMADLMRTGGR